MEIEIRQLTVEEMPESLRLSQFAFQYTLTPEAAEEKLKQLKAEDFWGYFVNGRLAAKMAVYPMKTWLNGIRLEMGGVASVATWPEYRRQGMVGKLLRQGLETMRASGRTVSFLNPFSFSFYRKYGWETYTDYKKYSLETAQLPKFADPGGYMETTADTELLNRIYEAYAVRYNGMLVRDEAWWKQKLFAGKPGTAAVYYDAEGSPAGYVYYRIANFEMTVHDIAFLDEGARRGLWRFIANHDSMIRSVTLKAPIDDPLPFLLDDPKIKQEIITYFMARIVDAEALLRQYPFAQGAKRRLMLEIEDAHAPWNDGLFEVRIDEAGSAAVERHEKGTHDPKEGSGAEKRLACGIGTLTAMLFGYRKPLQLHALGRLCGSGEAAAELEAALPARTTYLADFF
ncbi:enhanced intracellular survival protein Eis [Paenibacillus sp. MBLB4367]|uniref:GNAT family N-acetyltransferase n=1 Tax=Paenibacillus sp. MBLB4367 TaxID=3384767 RepID=UPI0039084182